jgi:hypothetical protein
MKKLRIWDESNADTSDEIYNEVLSYGGRFIKAVEAFPYSQSVHCGYTLVFDPTNIKPEDKTYLALTKGYKF